MDIVDPSRVCSMRDKWYVLIIVDDYSRYSWVFFLESKDEVFEHFQSCWDKFESLSSDGILLGYTPHGRCYRVFNLETNTIVESCDVTFDETAPYPHDAFECVSDKEMEESIFIDEGLQGVNGDKDDPLLPSTSLPKPIPASTLEAEAPRATTSSTVAVEASWVEGRSSLSRVLPLTFKRHIHLNKS
jgi:hypothetical protein